MKEQLTLVERLLEDWPTDETLLGLIINNITHGRYCEEHVSFLFCETQEKCFFWKENIALFIHLYSTCLLHQWKQYFDSKVIDSRYKLFTVTHERAIWKECICFYNNMKQIPSDLFQQIGSIIGAVYSIPVTTMNNLEFIYRTNLLEAKTVKYIFVNYNDNFPWNLFGIKKAVTDYITFRCSDYYVPHFQEDCNEILKSIPENTGNKEYPFKMRLYLKLFDIVSNDIRKDNINTIIKTYQSECLLNAINLVLTELRFVDLSSDELRLLANRVLDRLSNKYTNDEYINQEIILDDNIKESINIYSKVATYYLVEKHNIKKDQFRSSLTIFQKKELEKCVKKYVREGIHKYLSLFLDGLIAPANTHRTSCTDDYDYSEWYRPGYSG